MQIRLLSLILCLAVLTLPSYADSAVVIEANTSFSQMAPQGVVPFSVRVTNNGPSANGDLTVKPEGYASISRSYHYPIDLPSGTTKVFTVYPAMANMSDKAVFDFEGNANAKEVTVIVPGIEGKQIGVIGNAMGGLSALRSNSDTLRHQRGSPPNQLYTDCYARPEDAPAKAVGYSALIRLVLTSGCERMTPEQWAAIRDWVVQGGSLVVVGGADISWLQTPALLSLLPVTNITTGPVAPFAVSVAGSLPYLPTGKDPVALAVGTLKPGAEDVASGSGNPTLTRWDLGTGSVEFAGFNPFEKPYRADPNVRQLLVAMLHAARPAVAYGALWDDAAMQTPMISGTPQPGIDSNPFKVQLPAISLVVWLLTAYFVLVVPVTYFLLRKLKKLEMAWFTSPLLSIAFSFIFFLLTVQLRTAASSERTSGVLVGSADSESAIFNGVTELFFARGGNYTVAIPNAEAVEDSPIGGQSGDMESYGFTPGGGISSASLDTVDVGPVVIPDFAVPNLAFRRLYQSQVVNTGGTIDCRISSLGPTHWTGTIRNGTNRSFVHGFIYYPNKQYGMQVGNLSPGQSVDLSKIRFVPVTQIRYRYMFDTNTGPPKYHRVLSIASGGYFIARTSSDGYGPGIGKDVGGPESVLAIFSIPAEGHSAHE